ncbi:MAG: 50S ribosome-binding GTPase [Planctomycetes bacterium]|nr:50S ribosome-binding GTPase [Planctomycetota bacterium]
MPYPLDDTIAAVASPPGGAARGILRLSGPNVARCVGLVFESRDPCDLSTIRRATVIPGSLRLGAHVAPLPCDLYFWPNGRSYTGQPTAEIHTIGSPPLLEAALRAFCRSGSRLAQPGEFTLRAFLAGRLDLTRAEAVLGASDAADAAQFDVALAQLAGGLSRPLSRLRDDLLDLLAHLEAGFDFADEDLPFITRDQLTRQLAAAAEALERLARQMTSRREAIDQVRAVLIGWSNTGKSSLFNALSAGRGALVSDHPGTTRDYLTRELDLDGVRCLLIDTAGIQTSAAGPDVDLRRAAQTASQRQSRAAHLRLLCLDSSRPLNGWEREQLAADVAHRLLVLTKTDLPRQTDFAGHAIAISSLTGEGIGALRNQLRDVALTASASDGDVVAGTAVRCGESLRLAAESLQRARRIVRRNTGEELVAAEVRVALEELGKVVGAVYTDDMLDRIFSRFCIGK